MYAGPEEAGSWVPWLAADPEEPISPEQPRPIGTQAQRNPEEPRLQAQRNPGPRPRGTQDPGAEEPRPRGNVWPPLYTMAFPEKGRLYKGIVELAEKNKPQCPLPLSMHLWTVRFS